MILENIASGKYEHMYILLVNKGKNIFKPGRTDEVRKRMIGYATGKDTHPDIKFIMLVKNSKLVEKCSKMFLEKYQYKGEKELYKVDIDIIRSAIVGCAETDHNIQELEDKLDDNTDAYIIYDSSKLLLNDNKKSKSKAKQKSNSKSRKKTNVQKGGYDIKQQYLKSKLQYSVLCSHLN